MIDDYRWSVGAVLLRLLRAAAAEEEPIVVAIWHVTKMMVGYKDEGISMTLFGVLRRIYAPTTD